MEYNKAIVGSNRTLRYFKFQVKNIPDLTEKEKTVLLKRIKNITLIKIGSYFNVTEGRIRQIEKRAIAKLKSKKHQLQLFKKILPEK